MPDTAIEHTVVSSLENHRGEMELRDLHFSDEAPIWNCGCDPFWGGGLAVTEEAVEFAIPVLLLQARVQIIGAAISQDHEPDPEQ
jgi:hypothetical protein